MKLGVGMNTSHLIQAMVIQAMDFTEPNAPGVAIVASCVLGESAHRSDERIGERSG